MHAKWGTLQGDLAMLRHFTLEYWIDDGWYVGRLREVPGVFSQGETMDELEGNIRDAYQMMMADEQTAPRPDAAQIQFILYSAREHDADGVNA